MRSVISGAGMLLRYALVIGALGGLAEALYLSTRHLIKQQPAAWYSADVLWMAPLATALVFVVIAVPVAGAARAFRFDLPLKPSLFVLLLPTLYGITQLPGFVVHPWAKLILATGVAVAAARALGDRPAVMNRLVRRAALPTGVLLVLLALWGAWTLPQTRERRALAVVPVAAPGATNVLLIILDTVRAANLSLYGYERATSPNLDAWAQGGVVFDHAIAPSPWTLPTHASLFTGHYNFTTRTGIFSALDGRHPTLAEVLAGRGYATAGFTANLGYTTRASGLHRGFARYEDFPVTPGRFVVSSWVARQASRRLSWIRGYPEWQVPKTAEHITDQFEDWLDSRGDRPFFVFLNYYDAHSPYRGASGFREMFGPAAVAGFAPDRPYTTAELQPWINAYDGSIAYIDDQLGRVFATLHARGLRDNTLVIITSDHGEMFGEHGQVEHTSGLYYPVLHVPLAMALPGVLPAGIRVAETVTLRDLPATVLSAIELADDAPIPGRSLLPLVAGADGATGSAVLSEFDHYVWAPSWTPIARGDMKSLVEGPLHYIRNGDGVEELYDARQDPAATRDLSATTEQAPTLQRLRSTLDSIFR
jgi:arylsulfatase A-like enzyme